MSMTAVEIMMSRMLAQHQIHADGLQRHLHKEFMGRHESEMKRVITFATAQHVQPLNTAIAQERTARVQAIAKVHQQIQ